MQLISQLKTMERSVEKEIMAFFSLIGASEVPEEWEFCNVSPSTKLPPDKTSQTPPPSRH